MNSVAFSIDTESKVKRYYQLYSFFVQSIESGKLAPGQKLPSIRNIAEELNIGRNTVVKAYQMLEDEGYIFSYEKSGFFVKDKTTNTFIQQNLPKEPQEDSVPTVDSIVRQRKGTDSKAGLSQQNFSEFSSLFSDFSGTEERIQSKKDTEINLGTEEDFIKEPKKMTDTDSPFGEEHFRTTVTEFLSLQKKINCTPRQLIAGANIEELISNTLISIRQVQNSASTPKAKRPHGLLKLAQLAEAGELNSAADTAQAEELIAIPSNGAESLTFLNDVGFKTTELFCDIHGVSPSELQDSDATTLIITSTSASAKRREELLSWVNERPNRFIIEYDKEAIGAIPALQSEDKNGKIIYAASASDMVPKFHSCWVILPESLLDVYESLFGQDEMELSEQEQRKLVEFIESGELDQYLSARDWV